MEAAKKVVVSYIVFLVLSGIIFIGTSVALAIVSAIIGMLERTQYISILFVWFAASFFAGYFNNNYSFEGLSGYMYEKK